MFANDDLSKLTALVDRMVHESGRPEVFDARAWSRSWHQESCASLGPKRRQD
jgi:hypothetical protein